MVVSPYISKVFHCPPIVVKRPRLFECLDETNIETFVWLYLLQREAIGNTINGQ